MNNDFALRARRVPGWVRAPLVLIPLGLALYSCIAYAGPYRWLAEWQIAVFDGYEVVLTGAVVCIVALLPAVVAIQLLAVVWPTDEHTSAQRRQAIVIEEEQVRQNLPWILGITMFVAAAMATGYFTVVALRVDSALLRLDVQELEDGVTPASLYVELSGTALTDEAYGVVESSNGGSKITKLYIPVYSKRALSKPRRPRASVFVAMHESWAEKFEDEISDGELRGTLRRGGLPGLVRSQLERHGDDDAEARWVLSFHDTPQQQWTNATVFGSVTGFVAVLLGVGWFVRRRRIHRGSQP